MAANLDSKRPQKAPIIKARLLIVIMGALCPVICLMSRQNLSIAILSMVDSTHNSRNSSLASKNLDFITNQSVAITQKNTSSEWTGDFTCPLPIAPDAAGREESVLIAKTYGPKFEWSVSERSLVFETFFISYVVCQIPGARLAESLGSKWILAVAAFGSSLLSLLTPLAASVSVYLFAFLRGLLGVCQSAMLPACFILYTNWLPPSERRRALPILITGIYIGSVVASAATGYFSEKQAFGWPWAFYMPSLLCFLWALVWLFVGASRPRDHWFISQEEIEYIESRMEVAHNQVSAKKKQVSWKKIFTSRAVWVMMSAYFTSEWSLFIFLLLLPQYLNDILHISPFRNGLINSIIYILFIIASPIVGSISSRMIETKAFGLTHLQTRKLFECIALFSQAICFLLLPLIGCQTQLVLFLLFVQIILFSCYNGGEIQVPSELSVDFAGTIFAIGNCVGSTVGFIVPRVHSWVVPNTRDKTQWATYFYLATLVTTVGGLIFLFFAKNNLHDFSKKDTNDHEESDP